MNDLPTLPEDAGHAALLARVHMPDAGGWPAVATIRGGEVLALDDRFLTVTDVLEEPDAASALRGAAGARLGRYDEIVANTMGGRDPSRPFFLAPVDLQAIKATGVTFVRSLLERLIEEQTNGDPSKSDEARLSIERELGVDLVSVVPGSDEAMRLRTLLRARQAWSPYLEVGLGPDAELFTKAQPMSAVGTGAEIGIHRSSIWNNPEPEIVLAVNSRGDIVGATLGNDVNLRDFEGRSALLLGRAKDNNASCAIGPFLRLFDDRFTLDDVRSAEVKLDITGRDGFHLTDITSMSAISRDPAEIVRQATGPSHPNPDGLVLFLGAMFAPTMDRDEPGHGFTHKIGDRVSIASPRLGCLSNTVNYSDQIEAWSFGLRALMRSLAHREAAGLRAAH